MSLQALAASVEVQAAAWALLHFVWQGAVIAALLWLLLAIVPRSQARGRYAASCLALGLLAVAPAATVWYMLAAHPAQASSRALAPHAVEQGSYTSLVLLALWAVGSALMALRLLWGVARLRRLVARAAPPPRDWQNCLSQLALRMGVHQRVRLAISLQIDAPVVLGWLRPVILLPLAALTALPPASLEALLAHELGHVRRLDYLVNVVQSCVEALLFYHPAVHWVSRCMRIEREHCCDDVAIQITGEPLRYARALADMEELRARLPEPALAANGGSLMARIERITNRRLSSRASPRPYLTAGGVLAAALGLALAGIWACGSAEEREGALAAQAEPIERSAPALGVRWLPSTITRHESALVDTAQRHALDPALLAIFALVESMGDPRAQSPGGARGLMQLMPTTAAYVAEQRQIAGHSYERLYEPDYNLDLGAWYLSQQLASFGTGELDDRSVELAAVAYNGGPALARAYVAGTASLWPETKKYSELVVALWNERQEAQSRSFEAWRAAMQGAKAR